jgi:putative endonuclease
MDNQRVVIVPRAPRSSREGVERSDAHNFRRAPVSKLLGEAYEAHALRYLERRGMTLIARNVVYRGGELDLVMRDRHGVLVFVEVRARSGSAYGGALASVGYRKQRRLTLAARLFLLGYMRDRIRPVPVCRFDVIAFDRGRLTWIEDAFGAER